MENYRRKVVFLHPIFMRDPQGASAKMKESFRLMNCDGCNIEFEWSMESPDYIIASEMIYVDRKTAHLFAELVRDHPNAIRIFSCGEYVTPDMNIFDYASHRIRHFDVRDRAIRVPTVFGRRLNGLEENCLTYEDALQQYKSREFCNFIYSNANAHPYRDKIFYALEQYRHVDSLGGHLNNVGNRISRSDMDWEQESIRLKSNYRFSVSVGNACGSGNVDEKLITSFEAHSVPIFWGDPDVEEDFNPSAFINAHRFDTLEALTDEVRRIDQSPELWSRMVSAPWMTEEQKARQEVENERYTDFWMNVFTQNLSKAHRAPEGTWPDLYGGLFYKMLDKCVEQRGIVATLKKEIYMLYAYMKK